MSEVKTNKISSLASNNDITLDPDGTGDVLVASGHVGVGTTTPGTYTAYVSGSTSPGLVVAGTQPALVLSDTDVSGNDGTLGITKSGEDTLINNLGDGNIKFFNNGGERLTIDSSGTATFTEGDAITVIDRVGTNVAGIKTGSGDDFCVGTADYTQAIRIKNTNGHIGVGTTAPEGHFHVSSADSEIVNVINATNASYTGEILFVKTTRSANTTHRYLKCSENDGAAASLQILGNGNVQNANNSYGSISDQRIKQDVTDASSQWDDIKALNFKNYREKYRVSVDGDDAPVLLGLIAQDLETAGMNGLIEHLDPDPYQKDTLGIEEDVKAVKYSILYMKAVKALQEAMTRIETLETQRADLETRVAALEAGE